MYRPIVRSPRTATSFRSTDTHARKRPRAREVLPPTGERSRRLLQLALEFAATDRIDRSRHSREIHSGRGAIRRITPMRRLSLFLRYSHPPLLISLSLTLSRSPSLSRSAFPSLSFLPPPPPPPPSPPLLLPPPAPLRARRLRSHLSVRSLFHSLPLSLCLSCSLSLFLVHEESTSAQSRSRARVCAGVRDGRSLFLSHDSPPFILPASEGAGGREGGREGARGAEEDVEEKARRVARHRAAVSRIPA